MFFDFGDGKIEMIEGAIPGLPKTFTFGRVVETGESVYLVHCEGEPAFRGLKGATLTCTYDSSNNIFQNEIGSYKGKRVICWVPGEELEK